MEGFFNKIREISSNSVDTILINGIFYYFYFILIVY
jgi:hypothetical protein